MPKIVMSDPSGREKVYDITPEPQTWGRGEDSDVILGSRSVIRHHMRFWAEGDKVMVEDLTGGKGIQLDGENVSGTFELTPGLEMEAGVFLFRLHGVKLDTDFEGEVLEEEVPVPMLEGTKGPAKGLVVELQEGDNDIGRDPGLYLVIDENSISRLHARLTVESGKFTLVDMRSSNGTFVNKKKIESAELESGDLVRFGNVEFKFVYGVQTSEAEAARKKKKILLIGVGSLLGLFLIIGVCAKIRGSGGTQQTHVDTGPEEVPLEIRVDQHLRTAQNDIERFDWKAAKEQVEAALELHPISTEARKLLKNIRDEMVNKEIYDEGISLYDLSKWKEALAQFRKIPEDSRYYRKVKYKISDIEKRQSEYHFVEGKSYFRAQQYTNAHKHFISYMGLNPCDKKVYEKWIKKTEARMRRFEIRHKPFKYDCTDKGQEASSSIMADIDPQEVLKSRYPSKKIFEAMRLYFKGKAELGIDKLRRIKVLSDDQKQIKQAKALERVMMIVAGKYSEGTSLLLQGELEKAQEKFEIVLANDTKIIPKGLRSFYKNNIGTQLAEKLYKEGLEMYNRKEWLKCFNFWKECTDVSPDDRSCAQGLINLEEVAEEAIAFAKDLEVRGNKRAALDVLKQAMGMTRPESLPYKKARLMMRKYE